jgi:molecular chaperone DnaK
VQIQVFRASARSPAQRSSGEQRDSPARHPQIEVTFDIDANGIFNVSAKDLGTGKQQSVTISGGSALGKDDNERMMADAEKYADEDRQRREEAEVRNRAETLTYTTEKFMSENSEKLPEDVKAEVNESIAELKKTLEGTDTEAIRTATEKAAQASRRWAQPSCAGWAEGQLAVLASPPARLRPTTKSLTPRSSRTKPGSGGASS